MVLAVRPRVEPASLIESAGLLAFAVAVLADLRLLRKAYESQAAKMAVVESRQSAILDRERFPRPITEQ